MSVSISMSHETYEAFAIHKVGASYVEKLIKTEKWDAAQGAISVSSTFVVGTLPLIPHTEWLHLNQLAIPGAISNVGKFAAMTGVGAAVGSGMYIVLYL